MLRPGKLGRIVLALGRELRLQELLELRLRPAERVELVAAGIRVERVQEGRIGGCDRPQRQNSRRSQVREGYTPCSAMQKLSTR